MFAVVEERTDIIINDRTIGLVRGEATVERGPKFRHPIVLDGGPNVPHRRQLQTVVLTSQAGVVRVIYPGDPELAWVKEAPCHVVEPGSGVIVTREARATAVLALDRKAIAFAKPRQVELKPAADGPAPLVGGMPNSRESERSLRGKIGCTVVMRDGRDLPAAPSLIDPDCPDNVRNQS